MANEIEEMALEDQDLVARFAAGDKSLRDEAIAIHRRYNLTIGPRAGMHQQFMAECDHVVPDLVLRSRYRKIVLDHHGMTMLEASQASPSP